MIEVRLFATLREGREKIILIPPEAAETAADLLAMLSIPQEEVAILLINGFHKKATDAVEDGDIVSIYPPVGGG